MPKYKSEREAYLDERIAMLELERQSRPLTPDEQDELNELWEEFNELDL